MSQLYVFHIVGKLEGFKELKGGIFFVQEIPRSVAGKIMRRQLKNFWDRKDSSKDFAIGGAPAPITARSNSISSAAGQNSRSAPLPVRFVSIPGGKAKVK